jgi:hypothetical protein
MPDIAVSSVACRPRSLHIFCATSFPLPILYSEGLRVGLHDTTAHEAGRSPKLMSPMGESLAKRGAGSYKVAVLRMPLPPERSQTAEPFRFRIHISYTAAGVARDAPCCVRLLLY